MDAEQELKEARDRYNEARREAYRLDGDKRKADNKAWRDSHREQVREAGREYMRARRTANPDQERQRAKDWRAKNKEKVREYNRRNREGKFGREYNNAWQTRNKLKDPILYTWRNCRNRAKRLGLEFNLEKRDIAVPEFCPVLGVKLEWGFGTKSGFFAPNTPSVDRVDSTKGYVRGNIQVISNRANILKGDGTLDEFERIVAYMRAHQSS